MFKDSVDKAVALINEQNLSYMFSVISIEDILLADEIFHFIEEQNKVKIFTKKNYYVYVVILFYLKYKSIYAKK